jgi:hypothetical protein
MFRRFTWSKRPTPPSEKKEEEVQQEVLLPVLPEDNPSMIVAICKDKNPTS